jgi:alpha-beta hydrolase superfamily lysophospholipase
MICFEAVLTLRLFDFFRGMVLCTSIMTPKDQPIKAVVCYCHGYTDCASFVMRIQNQRLVEQGIAVASIEYEGHGRSDGPLGLINDWDKLIDDVSTYFSQAAEQFPGKPVFLMGESMGGAVAYCTYNRMPKLFQGVVFVCPMCKICDDMLPPQPVIRALQWLIGPSGTTSFLGFLPIAPARNQISNLSHKIPEKRDLAARVPTNYNRNPRLATARELISATQSINQSLSKFTAPFLVVHGKADRVTDPRLSEQLYNESPSKDKSIKLYEGMWHCLLKGEADEDIEMVYNDIISWVLERSS